MPALNIFESSLRRGKFDESRRLSNGKLLEFAHILPMDAVFDSPEDVPEEVRSPGLGSWPIPSSTALLSPGARLLSQSITSMSQQSLSTRNQPAQDESLNNHAARQVSGNKRYAAAAGKGFTVSEAAANVKEAVGNIDVLVHSLANGPEVAKPLLETSRKARLSSPC